MSAAEKMNRILTHHRTDWQHSSGQATNLNKKLDITNLVDAKKEKRAGNGCTVVIGLYLWWYHIQILMNVFYERQDKGL